MLVHSGLRIDAECANDKKKKKEGFFHGAVLWIKVRNYPFF